MMPRLPSSPTLEQRLAYIEKYGSGPARHIRRRQLGAYVLIVVLSIVGSWVAIHNSNRIAQQQQDLKAGLIRSCEKNGNPVRVAVRNQLKQEIKQSSNTKVLRIFFPAIPPAQLDNLVKASIRRDKAEIKQIHPVDCVALFR